MALEMFVLVGTESDAEDEREARVLWKGRFRGQWMAAGFGSGEGNLYWQLSTWDCGLQTADGR